MVPVFVAYFVLTLVLGLWQARRTKSQSDFVLGGKKLPGWMLALSERATGESAWLLLGLTGFIYCHGPVRDLDGSGLSPGHHRRPGSSWPRSSGARPNGTTP